MPLLRPVVDDGAAPLPRQRPHRPACRSPSAVRDADVARNSGRIERHALCVTSLSVRDGPIDFVFTAIHNPTAPDAPVWYLPHDNEAEAFDAAVYAVATYGGRMVAVSGEETRFYRAIDPNRHFAMTAADADPCRLRRPTPAYTQFVMDLFEGQAHILTLHNNTRGGSVTVKTWNAKTRGYRATHGPFTDPDHLVYIASGSAPQNGNPAHRLMDKLTRAGLNVVHETVTRENSDCSLSNHVVLNDGRPYFNIEAVHGSRLQEGMVETLMELLGHRPLPGG